MGAAVVVVVASVVVVLAVVLIGVVASVMVVVLAVVVVVVVLVVIVVVVVMVVTDVVEVGTEVVIVVGFAPQEARPQKPLPIVVFSTPCVPVLGLHVPVQLYDQATQPGVSWQCRWHSSQVSSFSVVSGMVGALMGM